MLFLYRVRGVLMPFFFAALITYLTVPAVNLLVRKQVPRVMAILLTYAIFILVASAIIVFVVPPLVAELDKFIAALPEQARRLEELTGDTVGRYHRAPLPAPIRAAVDEGIVQGQIFLRGFVRRGVETLLGLFSQTLFLLLSPVLAYYLTRDLQAIQAGLLGLAPLAWQADLLELGQRLNKVLSGYIRGQLLVSLFVGALTAFGLFLLKVPYALIIGLLAGIFDVIPYFGPVIGAVPAILLGIGRSPWLVLYVIILIAIVHEIEGSVVVPLIMQEVVGLHPVAVIFAVLAGAELWGAFGMLVAVPLTAALKVILQFALERLITSRVVK
ncbi:MAG: AI-2E family transporter [Firmicutes bacterium]|nr:AI-2E family transporter [Bacillota bacterium]